MHDPHKYPNYIFTDYIDITAIAFSHETTEVTLFGVYADLIGGGMPTICIETDFATLNDLLGEIGTEGEPIIEQISKLLSVPTDEDPIIDLTDGGWINITKFIFCFMIIMECDDDDQVVETEEYNYRLNAYVPIPEIFPDYYDLEIPTKGAERVAYLNSLIAMQYHVYLSCRKKMDEHMSLVISNLTDPLLFSLAETQYGLQESGQSKLGNEGLY
jgi:hypothetical protein